MKKCIILLLLLLLFMVSCTVKNESTDLPLLDEINQNDKKDESTDLPLSDEINQNDKKDGTDTFARINQINSDIMAYDGERIFYRNDNKLYSIKDDGSEKSLFFEGEKISTMQIHDNKIYMLSFDYEKEIPSKICSINIDGTGFNVLQLGLNFSSKYYISQFVVYNDFLIYTVNDHTNTNDIIFPRDVYKFDLNTNDSILVYEDLVGTGQSRVYENIFYIHEYGDKKYSILHKYDMNTNEKNIIKVNKNSHKEKIITSRFNIQNNYIYYSGKTFIDKDHIDGMSDTITLFEDNGFMITYMTMTDEYIFFIAKEEIRAENPNDDKTKLSVYKMNIENSEKQIIFNEIMHSTNIAPQMINIVTDDILIYSNRLTDTIVALDSNGNKLNWDL